MPVLYTPNYGLGINLHYDWHWHELQETMARRGTTKGQDAYDAEEARAASFASKLHLSLDELIKLVHAGEEAEIVLAAFRSGYLKPTQPELN